MKYTQLVVNGCSYMETYAMGNGHVDLAKDIGIKKSISLALGGSANSRIIRTTLKHSYITDQPTFYVLGLTFVNRQEIPILKFPPGEDEENTFEGRWTNPQNQKFSTQWEEFWTEKDTEKFVDVRLKSEIYSLPDRTEDLMYRLLSMINDLNYRGHQVLIFNQADLSLVSNSNKGRTPFLTNKRLSLLSSKVNIIHGLSWLAIPWQHGQGVPVSEDRNFNPKYPPPAENIRHRCQGHHQKLNEYLINYVQEHKILE